ncbi:MAG: hypothetical protein DRJ47_08490 [Thermoprotei archaeon]|nr:MAG: hypothetical protein DRJ47_08490 [Thermoprotei archaeon]
MTVKLQVDSVSKSYGSIKALENVSFKLREGEYLCVLGPTGAGKTTLLKIIAGLLAPDTGRIFIDGVDVTGQPPEARNVSYMPQGYALFPHMTVWENVAYGAWIKGLPVKKAEEALKTVGLYHRRDSLPHELSGGQQQRVALARALAAGSEILLLDEPLSALDALLNIELRYELKEMVKNLGLTVIHVTHNTEVALSVADKTLILRKGVVEQVGRPDEVYLTPSSLFVANFLSEINILEGVLRGIRQRFLMIDVGALDSTIYVFSQGFIDSWHVVVVYRPEDVILSRTPFSDRNVFQGRVETVEFLGFLTRFFVKVGETVIRVDRWEGKEPEFNEGDTVYVHLPPFRGLVYPYPKAGLIKELAVE